MLSPTILDKIDRYKGYLYDMYRLRGGPDQVEVIAIDIGIKNQILWAEELMADGLSDEQIIEHFEWNERLR